MAESSPDQGIKKIIISREDLPSVFGPENKYVIRYRFISEDKNRTSHWSPQYKVAPLPTNEIDHSVSLSADKNIITLVWESSSGISSYDVFVSWDNGDWAYVATVNSNTFVSLKKSGALSVEFAVQAPTFPRDRYAASTLFVTDQIDLVV